MFEHVFLDMDGVLCDFTQRAMAVNGHNYDEQTYPRLEWDICKVVGVSETVFWDRIDNDALFWEKLRPFPWFYDLMAMAVLHGEVRIVTTPSSSPASHSGKRHWLSQFGVPFEPIMCKAKHLLAAPGRLLIDDNDKNVLNFREAGGDAIVFPQPWNTAHEQMPRRLEYVAEEIAKLTLKLADDMCWVPCG